MGEKLVEARGRISLRKRSPAATLLMATVYALVRGTLAYKINVSPDWNTSIVVIIARVLPQRLEYPIHDTTVENSIMHMVRRRPILQYFTTR